MSCFIMACDVMTSPGVCRKAVFQSADPETADPGKRGNFMLLGMEDPSIAVVYVLCFVGALWCFVYGLRHWNDTD